MAGSSYFETPTGVMVGNNTTNSVMTVNSFSVNGVQLLPAIVNIGIALGDGTNVITTGAGGRYLGPFDYSGQILAWSVISQESGSIVVDMWKCTYSQFDAGATHPVAADKISANAPITVSGNTKAQSSTLTGWTNTFSVGDIFAFNANSVSNNKLVTIFLKILKTS